MTITRTVVIRRPNAITKGAWEYAEVKGYPEVVSSILDILTDTDPFSRQDWEIYLDKTVD